jgi:UDP-N-acetylmuramoylalanine--D-glutamate ligase
MSGPPIIDPDRLSPEAVASGLLGGLPVTVLGLARSGTALVRFFVDQGAVVTAYDVRPREELAAAIAELGDRPVRLLLGPQVDPREAIAGASLVATSPSINPDFPTTEPRLRALLAELREARQQGAAVPPLVSEVDLTLRLCRARTVGVTGTKGKTTTASLAAAILAADPTHRTVLGGNVGLPAIEKVLALGPEDRLVLELSELQLPTLSRGTEVAVYTTITADHLDRHGTVEAYRRVKARLGELLPQGGILVWNADDPVVSALAHRLRARGVSYRLGPPVPPGLGIEAGWVVAAGVEPWLVGGGKGRGLAAARPGETASGAEPEPAREEGPVRRLFPVETIPLPGRHNVANVLAATAVGLLFGLPHQAIAAATRAFPGVEHRLEVVTLVDGVRFVNDSQGTQPDAVVAALEAFPPPIVLIAGGRSKGLDLEPMVQAAARRAAAAVVIGELAGELEARLRAAGLVVVRRAESMEEAVELADALARSVARAGDGPPGEPATVLLSPGAASFDWFTDYAARGRAFKAAVAAVAGRRHGGFGDAGRGSAGLRPGLQRRGTR